MEHARELTAGGISGSCGVLATQPIDTIKIRLQHSKHNWTLSQTIVKTFSKEGIRGFFKGVASPAFSCGSINAVLFFSYKGADEWLISNNIIDNKLHRIYISGFLAGIPCSLLNCPSELIKCRAQVNTHSKGLLKDEIKILKYLIHNRLLFKGQLITLIRDVPSYGSYFWCYEILSTKLNSSFLAGGFSGMLSWLIVYPLDVFKTIHQTQLTTYKRTYYQIRSIGINRLFSGLTVTMIKAWPQNAVVFSIYENIINLY